MKTLLKLVPAPMIRLAGRLQFQLPFLRPFINALGQSLAGRGVIQRGEGKGLQFDATGCNPGYLAGTSDPEEQALVARYSRPGSVVYDVGANAGFYAVIAALKVGPKGHVYAFEPTPTLVERIRQNAQANGFGHLEVIEAAVTDAEGRASFGISGPLSVTNSLQSAEGGQAIEVEAVRLDTFAATHPGPDLLLLDIEGAELSALRGALETIRRCRPVIMVEVHWLGSSFPEFVQTELVPLGYTATTYEGAPLPTGPERYHALLLPGSPATPPA